MSANAKTILFPLASLTMPPLQFQVACNSVGNLEQQRNRPLTGSPRRFLYFPYEYSRNSPFTQRLDLFTNTRSPG
jgi:hypothetical protein